MDDIAEGFARLLGRQPSDAQRQRLYQVRDALGLADNDALWTVLIALEHYDSLYREYPEKLAKQALEVLEAQRLVLAETVAAETKQVQRRLAEAVVATSEEIAGQRANSARWRAWAVVVAALVAFGALCVACGCTLGAGGPPWWIRGKGGGIGMAALRGILGAPAGWVCLVLLVPVASSYSWNGLLAARDAMASRRERLLGGVLATTAAAAAAGAGLALVRLF